MYNHLDVTKIPSESKLQYNVHANNLFRKSGLNGKNKMSADSLHVALRPAYVLAQIFGIFPLYGICEDDPAKVRFQWISFRTMYSVTVISLSLSIVFIAAVRIGSVGIKTFIVGDVIFFACNSVVMIMFALLARKWPHFLIKWHEVEKTMFHLPPTGVYKKIRFLTALVIFFSVCEHFASNVRNLVKAIYCTDGGADGAKFYFTNTFHQIFSLTPYSLWKGLLYSSINFFDVIAWNFMDLFIMSVSLVLSSRFRQLNRVLEKIQGKNVPEGIWKMNREHYHSLYLLTKRMDDLLSPIVFVSFGSNLYFICLQLLNSLRKMQTVASAIYFYYSFAYLLARTTAVCLIGATIHDESRRCLPVLFSVPPETYCTDVQRLITQITSDELALTGCKFFSVTRQLILTIAGTIITYEIVLVQFNALNNDIQPENLSDFCQNI